MAKKKAVKKELPLMIFAKDVLGKDVLGAVFITKDSGVTQPHIWPAAMGLKKLHGCVEYGHKYSYGNVRYSESGTRMQLEKKRCEEIYYDVPATGEAWLVVPVGKTWVWYLVTNEVAFVCYGRTDRDGIPRESARHNRQIDECWW